MRKDGEALERRRVVRGRACARALRRTPPGIANYEYQSIAIYMSLMSVITVISVLLASETYRGDLTATHAQEGQPVSE